MGARKRGIQKTPQRQIQALVGEKKHLEQELRRQQTLLRAANRSLGLGGRSRKRGILEGAREAPRVRGKTVLKTLRREEEGGGCDGKAKRDDGPGGVHAGK